MDTRHEMSCQLLAILMFLCFVTSSAGQVRCYCNDARCVRTGYMCKSAMGRCFSQLTYERDMTRSVHGCGESLPLSDRGLCDGSTAVAEIETTKDQLQWPILLCCQNDMCNYMDNIDINIYVTKSNGTKEATWAETAGQNESDDVLPVDASWNRKLWFKAAVIAVPIAGGFILVLLVILAVRVLNNDNRRHRQLMQMRHHRSMAKAELYVADHFYHDELIDSDSCPNTHQHSIRCHYQDADSKPASASSSPVKHSNSIRVVCADVTTKAPNTYRDVLKVDNSKHRYEKIRPLSDSSSNMDSPCDSVVLWGDPSTSTDAATV